MMLPTDLFGFLSSNFAQALQFLLFAFLGIVLFYIYF